MVILMRVLVGIDRVIPLHVRQEQTRVTAKQKVPIVYGTRMRSLMIYNRGYPIFFFTAGQIWDIPWHHGSKLFLEMRLNFEGR